MPIPNSIGTLGFDIDRLRKDVNDAVGLYEKVYQAIEKVENVKVRSGSLSDLIAKNKQLVEINQQLTASYDGLVKAQNNNTTAANNNAGATRKQLDAFQQLNKEYKEAVANANKLGAELGVESQQFKDAAASAELLKQKIEGIKAATKAGGIVEAPIVSSTTNVSNNADEIAATNAQGVAVSELEIEQGKAAATAAAYGAAQGKIKTEIAGTATEIVTTTLAYDKFTGTLQQNLQAQIENNVALAENKAQQKALSDSFKAGLVDLDNYVAKLAVLQEEYSVINATNKELSGTINNQVKEFIAAGGSIDELRAQVNNLQAEYARLTAAERETPFGRELKAELDQLEPRVKELEGEIGKFQRNVGNYPKGSYNALKVELQQLTQQYANLTRAEQKSESGIVLKKQISDLSTEVKKFETNGANAFQSVFSNIRQLAYILPGLGIAGIFNIIFEGIMAAADALLDFGKKAEKAAEQTEKIAEAQEKIAANAERIRALETVDRGTEQRNLEVQLANAKALNLSKAEQLDIEQKLANERALNAQQRFNESGGDTQLAVLAEQLDKAKRSYEDLQKIEGEVRSGLFGKDKSNALNAKGEVMSVEEYNKALERTKSELDRASNAFERQKSIVLENGEAFKDYAAKNIEIATYLSAEQRKLILESTSLNVKLTKFANEQILSDTRSTLEQRLAAIRSNAAAEKALAEAQKRDVLANPASSVVDKQLAVRKAEEANTEAIRHSEQQQFQVREEYRKRDIAANLQYNTTKLKQEQEYYDKAANNPNLSLEQQLSALQTSQDIQKRILTFDHDAKEEQLKNTNRTQAELKADEAAYQADITNLVQKGNESRLKLIENYHQRLQQENLQAQSALKAAIQSNYQSDVDNEADLTAGLNALNGSLQRREISLQQYNEKRKNLERDYNTFVLRAQLQKDNAELQRQIKAGEDTKDIQIKINKDIQQLLDEQTQQYEEALNERKDLEGEFVSEIGNLITTIGDAKFERQINNYERLKQASDDYYNREIENIANSARIGAISDNEAADRTAVLNAEKEAAADLLDKKEREIKIKQARFEKAASIAGIAAKAAQAEVSALSYLSNPLTAPLYPGIAALIAGIAAAQIATVLATPIPEYKYGLKGDKPAHFGLYGEAGPELVEKPGFAPFVADKPTIDYLPAHTKITPLKPNDINEAMNKSMYRQTAQLLQLDKLKENNKGNDIAKLLANNQHSTRQIVRAIQKSRTSINIYDNSAYLDWKRSKINW